MEEAEKIPCTVEILTRNSGGTLERCLDSVNEFAEIIVLDGNSADNTLEIARRYGCKIIPQYENAGSEVRISDFSEVRNKGLRLAKYDWFMYIDSDEFLSGEAAREIRGVVESPSPLAHAWRQSRLYVLNGKTVRCASTYPNKQIRLFHRQWAEGFIKPVHERISLKPGTAMGELDGVEYVPVGTLDELRARWKRYLKAEEALIGNFSRKKLIRHIFRNIFLLGLFAFRYLRNFLFCRGIKMPLSHEVARHSQTLKLVASLVKKLL